MVHCSDGWDRTPQLCGLAQLLVDPYYRTAEGFRALVEKEFLEFGHMFAKRHLHASPKYGDEDNSPIFVLWLDCVWQVVRQFPDAFDFNEMFLLALADQCYSTRFGTFLCNSSRERAAHFLRERTASVWWYLDALGDAVLNPNGYAAFDDILVPDVSPKNLRLWEAYLQRFDESLLPAVVANTFY
mmetsp:Transcript_1862/g.5441  ORF Transcript_1862/g.5441 Transcript_1862/m.5441 type:complete len:185 (-) Transcript_1862:455-1009(-)